MGNSALRCAPLFAPLLAASAVIAATACSSQDPGSVTFGTHSGSTNNNDNSGSSSIYPDSGSPPIDNTPQDSGTLLPNDAGADDSSSGDASDASDAPSGPAVTSFTLIDTSVTNIVQGSPVTGYDPIKDKSTISLATVGTNLSVRANLNVTTIGSVGFAYNGTNHTENTTPYMLCGDNGAGTINNCNLAAGTYTITATPYSQANLGGTAGTPLTITFTLQ
jgi:hypothetical protein